MSYDEYDAARDAYEERLYNELGPQWAEENSGTLYEQFYPEVVNDFRIELLRSFYDANPGVAKPALSMLDEAHSLEKRHPRAAFVFAVASTEIALKHILLKPLVHGLVHSKNVAALVMATVPPQVGADLFQKLLFGVLENVVKVAISSRKRPDSKQMLWDEWKAVLKARNPLVHDGTSPADDALPLSLTVADEFVQVIVPEVLGTLGKSISKTGEIVSIPFYRPTI